MQCQLRTPRAARVSALTPSTAWVRLTHVPKGQLWSADRNCASHPRVPPRQLRLTQPGHLAGLIGTTPRECWSWTQQSSSDLWSQHLERTLTESQPLHLFYIRACVIYLYESQGCGAGWIERGPSCTDSSPRWLSLAGARSRGLRPVSCEGGKGPASTASRPPQVHWQRAGPTGLLTSPIWDARVACYASGPLLVPAPLLVQLPTKAPGKAAEDGRVLGRQLPRGRPRVRAPGSGLSRPWRMQPIDE